MSRLATPPGRPGYLRAGHDRPRKARTPAVSAGHHWPGPARDGLPRFLARTPSGRPGRRARQGPSAGATRAPAASAAWELLPRAGRDLAGPTGGRGRSQVTATSPTKADRGPTRLAV